MKRGQYEVLRKIILERFGEPIGDRETLHAGNVKNRGSDLCEQCGCMEAEMGEGCTCEETR